MTQGRRIPDGEFWQIDERKPGDYGLCEAERGGRLAFVLPTGSLGIIDVSRGDETERDGRPCWKLIEEDDGSITVQPSIWQHGNPSTPEWHGFLERGVWRSV